MRRLSDAALRCEGQPMFKVFDRVQQLEREGRDILHFELGDPNFETPSNIVAATVAALYEGKTHYTSSMGEREFREAVCNATATSRGFLPDLDQVLVTPGANSIIYLAISALVNPGDEVIIPDVGFPTYASAIKYCGAVAVPVNMALDAGINIERAITNKTRLIIINSPSNPTGVVLSRNAISEIAEIAQLHDLFLLSDEIYARLIYDDEFVSPSRLDHCRERTIILNGFSKAYAMTGFRLGVAIGPADVIAKMALILQTIVSCVPPFIQYAGIEAIIGDQGRINAMKLEYKRRRDILVKGLNSIKGITCPIPQGAIYVFPNITRTGMSSEGFAEVMLEEAGVALLPGTCFGEFGEGYVRLTLANSANNITRAIDQMKRTLK